MKTLATALSMALILVSCASYHVDSERNGALSHISVGFVDNQTSEGELSGLLKRQLQEQFATAPGFQKDRNLNWLRLNTTITEIVNRSIAESEVRDSKSRDKDADAYQTVLHRVELRIEFEVLDVSEYGKCLLKGKVTGQGDVPLMHDRNVSLKEAYLQATNDAAIKIKEAVADKNLEREK